MTQQKLFTKDFLALNAIIFLTYCNIAVFFQFHHYLKTLPLDARWIGLLIGLYALTALVVRPLVSPLLTPGNARPWIAFSTAGVIGSLFLYYLADSFWSMALVRVLHGGIFVVMASAVIARIVACIPPQQSARAFGMISVITLLPYAVIPPLLKTMEVMLGGFLNLLAATSLLMVFIYPLLLMVEPVALEHRGEPIRLREVRDNLSDIRVLGILVVGLLLFTAFTPVFFFIEGFGSKLGVSNPGWFFTLSTLTEITVRLVGGRWLDRGSKTLTLTCAMGLLALAYLVLPLAGRPVLFYGLGLIFGLAWGVAMPLVNALLFDFSQPRYRALNTNLGLEMFQGGFFLGPFLGGMVLQAGGYSALYLACGGVIALGCILIPLIARASRSRK